MKEKIKRSIPVKILYWAAWFLCYAGLILAVGTVVGSLAFAGLGPIFSDQYTVTGFLKKGAWVGFRYAGVWAGGVAIVLCCMRAYRLKHERKKACAGH